MWWKFKKNCFHFHFLAKVYSPLFPGSSRVVTMFTDLSLQVTLVGLSIMADVKFTYLSLHKSTSPLSKKNMKWQHPKRALKRIHYEM